MSAQIDPTKPLADAVTIANSASLCGMSSPVSKIYKRAIVEFLQKNVDSEDPTTQKSVQAIQVLQACDKAKSALIALKNQELPKYDNDALLSRHARALYETYIRIPFDELRTAIENYAGDQTEIKKLADILKHEARSIELELTNQIGSRKPPQHD